MGPGTLYGSIRRMQTAGLISESDRKVDPAMDDERRVYYRITGLGQQALATALLLLIPLVAMQFTDEVNWSPADFVVAGALLYGAGLAYELVARRGGNTAYRVAVGVAVGAVLLLLWVNGAVGLIGSEDNPANLLYGAVILVGLIGAVTARFHPRGMARTLFATAVVQALVPVIALPIWKPSVDSAEAFWAVVRVLEVNALFVLLFILSAVLFRNAVFTPPRAAADSN